MNPVILIILIGSLAGAAFASERPSEQTQIIIPDMSFHDLTVKDSNKIDNAVQNMLAGRESVADVQSLIESEYRNSNHDMTDSPGEIEIGTRYRSYLNSAYDVTKAFMCGDADLKQKKAIMNEKKKLI